MLKELFVHYFQQAIQPVKNDLKGICAAALKNKIAVYLGCIEKATDRGGHSLYCVVKTFDKHAFDFNKSLSAG